MSSLIEIQIERAIEILNLDSNDIVRLEMQQTEQLIEVAKTRFVEGNPRAWWLSLRVPYQIAAQDTSSGAPSLMKHWAIDEPFCWLVPEVEDGSYPVYQTTVPIVEKLLSQCRFFEYYLLNKPLDLLLIENDHNQIIVAQYIANR